MNDTEQDVPDLAAPGPAAGLGQTPSEAAPQFSAPSIVMVHNNVMLLTNPRMFFETLEALPVSLGMPALIVLAAGIAAAGWAYILGSVVGNSIAIGGTQGLGAIAGAAAGITSLIFTMLFWVIFTAAFLGISMAFKGRGDFNRLLAYVGYGHLPQVIGGFICLLLTWNHFSNFRVPSITDPQAIQAFSTSLMRDPTMRVVTVVNLLFLLWSANLWIFGVRIGRKLSTRYAAIAVIVPVAIYILLFIVPSLVA